MEYTILEYAELNDLHLKHNTRSLLGLNAVQLEKCSKVPIEKKWKWERGYYKKRGKNPKKGARIWPEFILQEIFFGGKK